jgi:hypothetical protein
MFTVECMRIGELARRAGTTTRALRFYESPGLLTATRSANGYREYGEDDLRLVTEIRALQTSPPPRNSMCWSPPRGIVRPFTYLCLGAVTFP